MNRVLLFLFSCFLSINLIAAPQLPGNCSAGLPNLLLKKTIKESEVNALVKSGKWGQTNKAQKYWTVYSDRSHNTTYNSPSTSGGKWAQRGLSVADRSVKLS